MPPPPLPKPKAEPLCFDPAEEKWFAEAYPKPFFSMRQLKVAAPPLAPIGDALADAWFR
jgi:hypothetical protein